MERGCYTITDYGLCVTKLILPIYCAAVNLLDLSDLREVLIQIQRKSQGKDLTIQEKMILSQACCKTRRIRRRLT
jgi:hypothetical protein